MEHLAETMTDFLLRRKYITEEQTEWCHYMLIKNIMSIASLVLLLPLGALIVGWGGTLFYTFVFRFLRARTGGYHAKTPHGCLLGSVCCQSVMLFLSAHMPDPVVSAFIAGFSCLSIALFGPANHPELHLSEKELKALQPRIYIRLLIVVALIFPPRLGCLYSVRCFCGCVITCNLVARLWCTIALYYQTLGEKT